MPIFFAKKKYRIPFFENKSCINQGWNENFGSNTGFFFIGVYIGDWFVSHLSVFGRKFNNQACYLSSRK